MAKAMKKSQRTEVLRYMKSHKGGITDAKANELFGVQRMGSVIYDLRQQGVIIETVMVERTNRYGNYQRFGRYFYRGIEEK